MTKTTPSLPATLTQIRNATLRIDYGGVRFLVDPMLAEKATVPGFVGSARAELRNPMVSLPLPIDEIVAVDAVIVTHLHADHWDDAAKSALDKTLPIFAKDEGDASAIRDDGFIDVRVMSEGDLFEGVTICKTDGQHGNDATMDVLGERLGRVCGFVLSHPEHRKLYVAGDTVWNDMVEQAISTHAPDVIVLNAGRATILGFDPIIMGEGDVLNVHRAAPEAKLVASHMEAVNHCVLSRDALRAFAETEGFSSSLVIPADGEGVEI